MENSKMNNRHLAVQFGQNSRDYNAFEADIAGTVQWLEQALDSTVDRVGLAASAPYTHWVVMLALLRLGKTVASIYEPDRLPHEIQSTFDIWISDAFNPLKVQALVVPPALLGCHNDVAQAANSQQSQNLDAFGLQIGRQARRLILTSGTTGKPKVVSLDAQQLKLRIEASVEQYGTDLSKDTRMVSLMGIDTIGGFLLPVATWLKGGTVLLGVPSPAGRGLTDIPFHRSNLLSAAPARLSKLLDLTQGVWPGRELRKVRVGGSRLHPSVRDAAIQRIGCKVQTTYGSTELGLVASCDASLLDRFPGAAGYVYGGVEVQIIDRNQQPLEYGQVGIVRCKTPGMAYGYESESASSIFKDGWFYPGDLGTLSADGLLVITGREGDVLNLGGLKLSAVDMETKLMHIEGLKDVCVVSLEDHRGKHQLVLAVAHGDEVTLDEMRTKIENTLPKKWPFHLVRVPGLPRNAMGKLPRAAIAQKLASVVMKSASNSVDSSVWSVPILLERKRHQA